MPSKVLTKGICARSTSSRTPSWAPDSVIPCPAINTGFSARFIRRAISATASGSGSTMGRKPGRDTLSGYSNSILSAWISLGTSTSTGPGRPVRTT